MEQHLLTAPLFGLAQLFLGEIGFLGGAAFLAGAALSGWSRVLGGAALLVEQRFWRAQRFLGGVGFGWSSALALHRLCILSQAALAAEG